ncbi:MULTISPECIES: aldehyde dehydrogenase [unclassified Colwellia]|uniref:aldehyde dehydrogenase n=1 Tax=unclassified Colwellia TaxID=196834 RepID=UPI0015F6FAE7|nr:MULTISPECIES: aldehyde dehydrogenase [unclassified Colwellia]MBA6234174.1 aldehyde dehydrogenase [Colwellia sp. MB02u-7]MBA6237777.1 aldehyde dehydrogenase [Colwellia sp. MB02u-11]MBA6254870.1 aldehyde dehydrogenase [Colwellia sp. MB3u-28]MBA6259812.1 aldehyde dehydrogenase [Colwellia sp. MB3u-41]MBA6300972.1 aldehyde dehydrogenase [Colwellia sp. MB3u-22]
MTAANNIIDNFIDGEYQAPINNHYLDNYEPATGLVYGKIPSSDSEDVEQAIAAAERALPAWRALDLEQRADYLMAIAQEIENQLELLALAEATDNGKPVALARMVDIPRAASNFKFFAHACSQFSSESHALANTAINYTLRQPVGIVGCISPWNLPLYLFTWKIAPALAAGNCVIAKPSEITPKTAAMLGAICQKVGLPKGVLNILHGTGTSVGAAICNHPKVNAISFTGGSATGAAIATQLAPKFKKLSLELGGKNPALIFDDCHFENTIEEVFRASFANQGQICLCASRLYIQRGIYEKFKAALVAKAQTLVPQDPLVNETKMGAIVSKDHLEKVLGYIDLAKQEGGTILAGGKQVLLPGRCKQGYFLQPTIIEGLSNDARCNQQEIFGPVITLQLFDTDEQALALANESQYGLAATIWTQNINRAHQLAEQINTGIVWINCWLLRDLRTPFGGMNHSGVGREGGLEAMRFFTEPKNVCIKYS